MSALLSITDPAEDAALIAARAYYQSRENGGYDTYVGRALESMGLGTLTQNHVGTPIQVNPESLAAWLQSRVEGAVLPNGREASNYNVANAVYRTVSSNLATRLYEALETGAITWTVDETQPQFNPDELCRKYGYTGALPRATGAQRTAIEDQRRSIARGFAQVADNEGLCGSFDSALSKAGLGKYMPDRDATVSVDVPGFGPMDVEVQLSRAGTIEASTVRSRIIQAVNAKLADALDLSKASGLPEGALLAA